MSASTGSRPTSRALVLANEPIDLEVFDLFPFAPGREGPVLLWSPTTHSGLGTVYMTSSAKCCVATELLRPSQPGRGGGPPMLASWTPRLARLWIPNGPWPLSIEGWRGALAESCPSVGYQPTPSCTETDCPCCIRCGKVFSIAAEFSPWLVTKRLVIPSIQVSFSLRIGGSESGCFSKSICIFALVEGSPPPPEGPSVPLPLPSP